MQKAVIIHWDLLQNKSKMQHTNVAVKYGLGLNTNRDFYGLHNSVGIIWQILLLIYPIRPGGAICLAFIGSNECFILCANKRVDGYVWAALTDTYFLQYKQW